MAGATTTSAAAVDTTTPAADPLGKPNKATGSPVKVGYINSGVSAAIDGTEEAAAADATVKYVNDYLGGIAGHEIQLDQCATNEDPAIAATCGDKMIQDGVVAVLMNVNGQVAPWATPVIAAKIPIIAYNTADGSTLVPGAPVFVLSNPLGGLGVFPAAIAKKNSFTKAAIVTVDVPAAVGPVKALVPPTMAASGVPAADIVALPQGQADFGPQIQAELKNSPQLVHIIGNPAFCASVITALRDASYTGVITMISNCLDKATVTSLGDKLKGILVSYNAGEDPTDPDFTIFKALVAKYNDKINPSGTPVGAYVAVIGFQRLLNGITGDVTSASIISTIKANPGVPYPTIKGNQIICDGKQTVLPIGCSKGFAYATLDATGTATGFTPVLG